MLPGTRRIHWEIVSEAGKSLEELGSELSMNNPPPVVPGDSPGSLPRMVFSSPLAGSPPVVVPGGSPGPFPRMALSSPLAGYDVTLAEGENAVIALRALQALPGVLFFALQIFSAPGLELRGRGAQKVPRPEPAPGGFVVEALFKDAESPGDEPVRVPVDVQSGGGGMGRWDISYWFRVPEPVPAGVALAVAWPDAGIPPTVLSIARDDILRATPEELSFPR